MSFDIDQAIEYLKGYKITKCEIRATGELAFVTQDDKIDDPMEPAETWMYIYKPHKENKNQWDSVGLGTSRRMLVIPSYLDNEEWIFVSGRGEFFTTLRDPFLKESYWKKNDKGYIFGAKTIDNTGCYMVGPNRKIIKRAKKDTLRLLSSDIPSRDYPVNEEGFCDIDGFSNEDIYACGGASDLWQYNGKEWNFIELPTNTPLRKICCGKDGKVYILADNRFLIIGREDKWIEYSSDNFEGLGADIKWYKDRLLILTGEKGYELKDNELLESEIIESSPIDGYSCFSSYNENLLLANGYECALYNGKNWKKIL